MAGEPAGSHSHHAVQVALPFAAGGVRFQTPFSDWLSYPAAIVAPDQPHAFEARGQFMATLFVEPESLEGRALCARFGADGIQSLDPRETGEESAALAAAYARADPDASLIEHARAVIRRLARSTAASRPGGDPRIARAIELIRNGLDKPVALRSLAAATHLSPDRFRHLFIDETGVALRPYVLWLRLEIALAAYVAGRTLTEAAYAGGFADSAHFSRTFKRMFGITPASVRPQ